MPIDDLQHRRHQTGRSRWSKARWPIAVIALFAALAAATAPSAAEPATPQAAAITVTPSTGLVQGDTVTVAGTGFPAATMLGVIQCIPGTGVESCNTNTLAYVTTNGSGAFSMTFTPRRILRVAGVNHDCSTLGECRIGVGTVPDGSGGTADADIRFDPSVPPPPPPTITATPDTGLLDNGSVVVSGEGFDPSQFVYVLQCLAPAADDGSNCRFNGSADVQTSPSGTFTLSVTVRRVLFLQGTATDCADPGACVLVATSGYPGDGAAAAGIEFDGSVPLPPPPTATATPDTDLLDGDTVSVTGSGFSPNTQVAVIQCQAIETGDASACNTSAYLMVQTDGSGGVTADLPVDRMLYLGSGTVDCVVVGCRIVVAELPEGFPNATADIAFDASVPPPPPPTLVADPSTGLANGQTVTVHGSGYPRNRQLGMAQCLTGDSSPSGCDLSNYKFVQTDDTGSFTTTFTVHISYRSDNGPVDCRTPGLCRIGAGTAPGGIGADALLTFSTAPPTTPTTQPSEVESADAVAVTPSFTG
jgi:hypothetical protein